MPGEDIVDRVHAFDGTALEFAGGEALLHLRADGFPFGLADFRRDAAVGEDLDGVVGEQDVDQHAAVVLRVPDAQVREHFVRTFARAAPAFFDVPVDDRALAAALMKELPARPDEVAFVESDPRYGLRFYLGAEIERLELPGDAPNSHAQDIASEMSEHEGCRVLLVNAGSWPRLEEVLAGDTVTYKRLDDVRGYAVAAQGTPDCPAYGAL